MEINKIVKSACLVATATMAFSIQAAQVTFGGVTPTDGSVQTAGGSFRIDDRIQYIDASGAPTSDITNIVDPASGFFIETFDQATVNPILGSGLNPGDTLPGYLEFTGGNSDGCSLNSAAALDITSLGGNGLGVQMDNTNQAAHATANVTCFGFAPQIGEDPNATITVDYSNFLPQGIGETIGYLGLYYGSIDTYNALRFGNIVGGTFVPVMTNFGIGLEGNEILDLFSLQSGNRDTSNRYVNVFFDDTELFTALQFINSNSRAFEVDNIVVGTRSATRVSEPGVLALMLMSLVCMLSFRRRVKK